MKLCHTKVELQSGAAWIYESIFPSVSATLCSFSIWSFLIVCTHAKCRNKHSLQILINLMASLEITDRASTRFECHLFFKLLSGQAFHTNVLFLYPSSLTDGCMWFVRSTFPEWRSETSINCDRWLSQRWIIQNMEPRQVLFLPDEKHFKMSLL